MAKSKKSKLGMGKIVLAIVLVGAGSFAAFHFYAINKHKKEQAAATTTAMQPEAMLARRRFR